MFLALHGSLSSLSLSPSSLKRHQHDGIGRQNRGGGKSKLFPPSSLHCDPKKSLLPFLSLTGFLSCLYFFSTCSIYGKMLTGKRSGRIIGSALFLPLSFFATMASGFDRGSQSPYSAGGKCISLLILKIRLQAEKNLIRQG